VGRDENVRWMCGMKLQDQDPSKGLREKPGLDDIILVLKKRIMLKTNLKYYA